MTNNFLGLTKALKFLIFLKLWINYKDTYRSLWQVLSDYSLSCCSKISKNVDYLTIYSMQNNYLFLISASFWYDFKMISIINFIIIKSWILCNIIKNYFIPFLLFNKEAKKFSIIKIDVKYFWKDFYKLNIL